MGEGEAEEEVKAAAVYLFTIDMLDLPVSAVVAQLTSFNRLLSSSVNRKFHKNISRAGTVSVRMSDMNMLNIRALNKRL